MNSIDDYKGLGFSVNQLKEIEEGLKEGIDVDIYARLEFVSIQMNQIRLGLKEGLDVSVYARPEYDWFQMEEIRKGLLNHVKVSIYANPSVSYDRMRQIRKGLQVNIDLSAYKNLAPGVLRVLRKAVLEKVSIIRFINEGYDENQLDEIRIALSKGLDIVPYLNKQFRGICIREIALGLLSNIDVSLYANTEYNWQQMREIRLGLENRVEVKVYLNPWYDWEQMQEIRLGLMHGIDIVSFRSLMYPGCEMREMRLKLEKKAKEEEDYWHDKSVSKETISVLTDFFERENAKKRKEYDDFLVLISQDEMEVIFALKGRKHPISKAIIDDALETYGINYGIDDLAISHLVNGDWTGDKIIVAKGECPIDGSDGRYEYFFRTNVARTPKVLPDGSVDFHDIEWFERTYKGNKIAEYHHPLIGTPGHTVFGDVIPPKKGVELPVLTGTGFRVDETGCNYYALMDGIIELKDDSIEIKELLVLDEVSLATGDVKFGGDIYVKGNVFGGMKIEAGGDLVIDGYVEKVYIKCDGNVVLHQGINASGEGEIVAGGDVIGTFFEAVTIRAEGSIRADYSMNSNLYSEDSIKISGKIGSLVGGVASAETGIEAYEVGNRASMATTIRLGSHEAHLAKLDKIASKLKTSYEELATLGGAYRDYQKNYPPEVRNVNPLYLKIEAAIYTLELQTGELNQKKNKLEYMLKDDNKAEIVVKNILYDGVTAYIGDDSVSCKLMKRVRIKKINNHIALLAF